MPSTAGLILQHGDDGPPGRFEEWLRERGIPFHVERAWEAAQPADPRAHAFVASLGSEHSAAGSEPAWVGSEIAVLREAIAADVPVLGLCFGGQALSVALDGGVVPADPPEIGWMAVDSADDAIPAGPWLQYHHEVMLVPAGAVELARSPAGPAAFRHGRHLALQFHPEVTPEVLDLWARRDPALAPLGITPALLAEQSARHAGAAHEQAFVLFDAWWAAARA